MKAWMPATLPSLAAQATTGLSRPKREGGQARACLEPVLEFLLLDGLAVTRAAIRRKLSRRRRVDHATYFNTDTQRPGLKITDVRDAQAPLTDRFLLRERRD